MPFLSNFERIRGQGDHVVAPIGLQYTFQGFIERRHYRYCSYNGAALGGVIREESSYDGSRSILVSGQASRLGLGASDCLAGMGGSLGNSRRESSGGGGSHAASPRWLPVLRLGDGITHAADLLREGRAAGVAVVYAHRSNTRLPTVKPSRRIGHMRKLGLSLTLAISIGAGT